MTDIEALISDLVAKAEKATAGPWELSVSHDACPHSVWFRQGLSIDVKHYGYGDPDRSIAKEQLANAAYIAAANPAAILSLLDAYEAMKRERNEKDRRAYELAVAIMGGEDVPGYADSIETSVLVDLIREERANRNAWTDAAVKVATEKTEAERDEAVKALERLNNWWLENHPGGPDGDRSLAGGFGKLDDDTIEIWRAIQAAIPNAKHSVSITDLHKSEHPAAKENAASWDKVTKHKEAENVRY